MEKHTGTKFKTMFLGTGFGYEDARKEVVMVCKRLAEEGLAPNRVGNVSRRVKEGMVITPTGADLGSVLGKDLVLVTDVEESLSLVKVRGFKEPSSEAMMHWFVYKNFKVGAVIHVHDDVLLGHKKFVETEKEYPYGTPELAHEVVKALKKKRFVVLKNHGVLAAGKDLKACHAMIGKAVKSVR
jgi:L-fuculose-phosphate aldolase